MFPKEKSIQVNSPFFTIIIPTKNRPQLLKYSLQSVLDQSFTNFECIVINNSDTEDPTKETYTDIVSNDSRFRYIRPKKQLPMSDNWELATNYINGRYISILIDKVMLLPNCLSAVYCAIDINNDCEVFNWWSEAYNFRDEELGPEGIYQPTSEYSLPEKIESEKELKRRISFLFNRQDEGIYYFRGKICFGVYKREIVLEAKERIGKLFYKFSPDYTSLISGLVLSKKIYDIGMVGCISINSKLSNGGTCKSNDEAKYDFIKESDPEMNVLDNLPVENEYDSIHNFIAYDYAEILSKYGMPYDTKKTYLDVRVREDLLEKGNQKKKNIYNIFQFACNHLHKRIYIFSINIFARKILLKFNLPLSKYLRENLEHREFCREEHNCDSPLDALKISHSHYSSFSESAYSRIAALPS